METLFSGNIVVVFFLGMMVILSYTNFEEEQKIFVLYFLIYSMAFFEIVSLSLTTGVLIVGTFIYLEYLSEDNYKTSYITSIINKLLDYFFMMVFQFYIIPLSGALACLYCIRFFDNDLIIICLKGLSIILVCVCEHHTITQPFKVKSFSGILSPFLQYPYYDYDWNHEKRKRYSLLCQFEDTTFFSRKKSYTFLSREYIKQAKVFHKAFLLVKRFFKGKHFGPRRVVGFVKENVLDRGYSLPEMQLIRTIGVERGYDTYRYRRKVYELVYSHILFSSMKKYYINNSGPELDHFRDYILDIYFKTVLTKVNGVRYPRFKDFFENPDDIEKWPLEGVFVACMGLSFREVNARTIEQFSTIIDSYRLSREKILEYAALGQNNVKVIQM